LRVPTQRHSSSEQGQGFFFVFFSREAVQNFPYLAGIQAHGEVITKPLTEPRSARQADLQLKKKRSHVLSSPGGAAVQKALGRGESMVVEFGCVAAVSEACKMVAGERGGLGREPPYTEGFAVKITGERVLFVEVSTARSTDIRGQAEGVPNARLASLEMRSCRRPECAISACCLEKQKASRIRH